MSEPPSDRRRFLAQMIRNITVGLGLMTTGMAAFVLHTRVRERRLRFFPVLEADELPRRGVRKVTMEIPSGDSQVRMPAFVVANGNGRHYSLSARCSHLGCLVNWDSNRSEFLCPCHGGRYNMRGEVVGGPPPSPLERLPLEIRGGKVFVGYRV